MRTIESRRFVAGKAELRIFLIEEKDSSLPFRLRLKHSDGREAKAGGILAGFKTEEEPGPKRGGGHGRLRMLPGVPAPDAKTRIEPLRKQA